MSNLLLAHMKVIGTLQSELSEAVKYFSLASTLDPSALEQGMAAVVAVMPVRLLVAEEVTYSTEYVVAPATAVH